LAGYKAAPVPVPRARVSRSGDDVAVSAVLAAGLQRHRRVRFWIMVLFALLNCAAIASVQEHGHAVDLSLIALEAVVGLTAVATLAYDDGVRYAAKIEKLIYHWKLIATRDSLTGLYNRLAFLQTLDKRISLTTEKSARYGVMFIDLNKFKQINDLYGHEVGDNVLRIAARRLLGAAGSDDMVARLGGDEFAILMSRTNVLVARKLEFGIEQAFRAPISINGKELIVTASIGTCLESDHYHTSDELIRAADTLMYRQKAVERWRGNTRIKSTHIRKTTFRRK
jgi:diguanylate cyclase (GGDEF)-like protein